MSNDETQPASGNRWEDQEDQAPQPAAQPAPPAAPTPAYTPAPETRGNRGKLLLAGGAVGIALVAGTGGFALGNATAGDGRDGPGQFGRPGNFPNGGPGGQDGFGQFGGNGQPPGGFQDRRDGDDDQRP